MSDTTLRDCLIEIRDHVGLYDLPGAPNAIVQKIDAALRSHPAPAEPVGLSNEPLRPPGGEKWDDPSYLADGLTPDHICRMWARYVDQTHAPPENIALLIRGVTADVLAARVAAAQKGTSNA